MPTLCGASSKSPWREAPQSRAVPTMAERIDAANTAILAAEKSGALGNACPGDKERHREADASEGSRPGQLPPAVLCWLDGYACAHGRSSREEDAERLSYGEASDNRGHEPAMPDKDARIDRHARIRQCEDREDSVARPRAGMPQQLVGGRF